MTTTSLARLSFAHDGLNRTAHLKHSETPTALVVLLHPIGSDGIAQLGAGEWPEHFALLAPNAHAIWTNKPQCARRNPPAWSSLQAVLNRGGDGSDVDDLGFIDAAIAHADAHLGVRLPLLLVGHSNGCAMGFRVVAEGRHRKRFVAASLMAASWAGPKKDLHCAVMLANGSADPIRPWEGHPGIRLLWMTFPQDAVDETMRQCQEALGGDPGAWTQADNTLNLSVRENHSGRRRLKMLRLKGQGHGWPVGEPVPERQTSYLGPNNESLNMTDLSAAFFAEELAALAYEPALLAAA